MKIIHLVANKVWGGGEQYVYDIVEALQGEDSYGPIVICKDIECLKKNFAMLQHLDLRCLKLSGYFDVCSIISLKKILDNQGKCLIHAHDFKRAFIALVARKLCSNRNVKVIMTRHLVKKAKNSFIERFVYSNIDKILFVSHLSKKTFFLSNPIIDKDKCIVLHNGVKMRESSIYFDIRSKFNLTKDCMILMFHGRIAKEKGPEIIIDALSRLNENIHWKMFFIGDGDKKYIQHLKERANDGEIANNVIWISFQKDVMSWIKNCDCGVMPSIAQESFGLSDVEYMMAAKPVITTNNGAQKEYIKDKETGLLIPPNDADALADALTYLYKNNLGKDIGVMAQKYYKENLSFETFYSKLIEIYEQ